MYLRNLSDCTCSSYLIHVPNEELVCEAIINAPGISKKIRSVNPTSGQKEYLYVIIGLTFDDLPIYTKGKIVKSDDSEKFYVLISSKKSV